MSPLQGTVRPPERVANILLESSNGGEGADARVCRHIVVRHARTFSVASRLLPREKRRAVFAIYATCRTADDIVDLGSADASPAQRLSQFRTSVFSALAGRSEHPVLRELARAWGSYDVPDEPLRELFHGLELDLGHRGFGSWPDLETYCQDVAGSVGEMCSAVFGVAADQPARRSAAIRYARTLGVAMQLTNILRDVGEDARRGRCYLPRIELERFGLSREQVLSQSLRRSWSAWRELMRFQVARARGLYREALPGIALLERDAQRCAWACSAGYASILDAIEEADYDTFTARVAASRLTLLGVAWRSWWSELPLAATPPRAD
jgi:phytoene synthase